MVFLRLAATTVLILTTVSVWPDSGSSTRAINTLERSALSPSSDVLELGNSVASSTCASCHGTDGNSTGPGIPNLAGQRTVYLYRALQAYQARQRRDDAMNHAISFLHGEALLAVSAYYASLPPVRPADVKKSTQTESPTDGRDPFAAIRPEMKKCVKCHGDDGNAKASGMPNLTAQHPQYFVTSMKAYVDGNRDHKMMERLVSGLDDDTLEEMGVFYAVQEPVRTKTTGDGNPVLGREQSEPCASCHGEDGNPVADEMPTLAGQDARYFIKAMAAYQEGKRSHDAMFDAVESLTEDGIQHMAAFYAEQNPVRRGVHAPLTTEAWLSRCERCHGPDGNSTDPRFPMLAGQDRTYLQKALQAYIDNNRGNSTMHAMSEPLSANDISQIVEYFATREPRSVIYSLVPCGE